MQALTGASNKFSSPFHDASAQQYISDVNSNVSSASMMSSPASKTILAPFSSIQSTLVPPLEGIDLAGRILDWQLKNDNQFPSLSDQLKIGESHGVSGLSDVDYPVLEAGPNGLPLLRQMGVVNRIPLPPELVEHFGHMQSYCMMGLFPLIQRAWLTIDSDIYVWTYEDGGDLSYFDGLSEPIIAVELVVPKAGIFQPHIQYLLCLATTVEIVLLGVSFSGCSTNYEEMHLLPESLFAVPTDGAYIVTIAGTMDGRIFMGAKDGCIYEFFYQAEEGFFGRKCRKINHSKSSLSFLIPSFINAAFTEEDPLVQMELDESRHILYTRSEKGTIQVYDLGLNGQAMTRIAAVSATCIIQAAANIARTVDRSIFRPLVSISPMESSESTNLHLVAITASGVRLYFSTLYWRSFNEATPSARPVTLQLVQVRLPPGYAANAAPQRPQQVHSAIYSGGTTFLASSTASDNDVIWCLSNSLFPAAGQLVETQNTLGLEGKTWALAEVTRKKSNSLPPAPEPPTIVTQHYAAPRKFIFLTTQCCHVVTQLRPVDILRQLLIDASGPDSMAVRAFFQVLKEDQACATSLILACCTSIQDSQLADWAARAFFQHGGEVRVTSLASSPFSLQSPCAGNFNPNAISTPMAAPPVANNEIDYQFSARHDGFYLYFGRILRPLWLMPLATELGKERLLDSVVTSDELVTVLNALNAYKAFVHANIHHQAGTSSDHPGPTEKGRLQEAQMQERKSLLAMKQLLDHTVEVLGLWKVLCDHQLHLLGQWLPNDLRMSLKSMLFRDLILAGGDTCIGLINSLIGRYLDDAASTDAISHKLRQVCPSLYRNEDALCTKVNEQLLKARSMSRTHRDRLLHQTLDTCKQIPASRINLAHVCQQLAACQFYEGVVELCCVLAKKLDPQQALSARKNCYQQICIVLQQLYTMAASGHPQSPSVPKSPGPLVVQQVDSSPAEALRLADDTLSLALQSHDELCHVVIFDWLVDNKWHDKLLEIQSPHLENYLKKQTVQQSTDLVAKYDLLWKFYEKSGQFIAAARVLSRLADAHSTAINLPLRIEYLSRAIVCARAAETSSFGNAVQGQFLYELEEKMDVAKVQSQVLEAVGRMPNREPDVISRLNADLLDVTQLYEQFAEPLGLWECKLAILHCAGHYDAALVANVWHNVINAEIKKLSNAADSDEAKCASLGGKMKTLARSYAQSDQFFPLEFIIRTLETCSIRWSASPGWVVSILLDSNVAFQRLFATYNRLYTAKEAVWQAEGKPNHLLHVLADMLRRLVESPATLVPTAQRRALAGQCVEAVDIYLTDLYCTAHATSAGLIADFRNIQAKLERL